MFESGKPKLNEIIEQKMSCFTKNLAFLYFVNL